MSTFFHVFISTATWFQSSGVTPLQGHDETTETSANALTGEAFSRRLQNHVDAHIGRGVHRAMVRAARVDLRAHSQRHKLLRLGTDHAVLSGKQKPGRLHLPSRS